MIWIWKVLCFVISVLSKALCNVLDSRDMATRAKAADRGLLGENGVRRALELEDERFVNK